eukprot:UN21116
MKNDLLMAGELTAAVGCLGVTLRSLHSIGAHSFVSQINSLHSISFHFTY